MKIQAQWYGGMPDQSPSSTMAKEKKCPRAEIHRKPKLF
jgi:hypothetical protein